MENDRSLSFQGAGRNKLRSAHSLNCCFSACYIIPIKSAFTSSEDMSTPHRLIEVRSFKWPHRATAIAHAVLLGEDAHGRWLGIAQGRPWSSADGLSAGTFTHSFVKLVPVDTWWTACFQESDPIVDVDIVLPVQWIADTLEEVDLELDILQYADGNVSIRDQEVFQRVREDWDMPNAIATQAEHACQQIYQFLNERLEPFNSVGRKWLALHPSLVNNKRWMNT
jgi:uncharacterized protein